MFKIIILVTLGCWSSSYAKVLCSNCIYRYFYNQSEKVVNVYLANGNHKFPQGINIAPKSAYLIDSKGKYYKICLQINEQGGKKVNI